MPGFNSSLCTAQHMQHCLATVLAMLIILATEFLVMYNYVSSHSYFNIYSHAVDAASTFITYDNLLQKSSPSTQYHCNKIIHVGLYPPVWRLGNHLAYILCYRSSRLNAHANMQLKTHLSATFLMTSHLSSWTRILNCLTVLDVVRRPTRLPSTTFVLPLWNLSTVRHKV